MTQFFQTINQQDFFNITNIKLTEQEWEIFVEKMQSNFCEYASKFFEDYTQLEVKQIIKD
jgi:hypothetical protein